MDKNTQILLNKARSAESVNVTSRIEIDIENTNKPLPLNDIDSTLSQYAQFLKEREASTIYRFYGEIDAIVSNPLYNENVKIARDINNPNNIVAKPIAGYDIFERDGWIGYINDTPNEELELVGDNQSSLCEFFPFDPGFDRLNMLDSDGKPNYMLKLTYPYDTMDITLVQNTGNISLKDGIPVITQTGVNFAGTEYVIFKTPINHGLDKNDKIKLYNFDDLTPGTTLGLNVDREFVVYRLGDEKGNNPDRIFMLEINTLDIGLQVGKSTFKRVTQGVESEYYVRKFKALTSNYSDYNIYPAAFGVNYYNDKVSAYNYIVDIDVDGITDNLGRPLSEIYLTIVKNDNDTDPNSINAQYWINKQTTLPSNIKNRFWTRIKGGFLTEKNGNVNYNIRAIGDPDYSQVHFTNIDESDNEFVGDIVEYNEAELLERRLEEVYHRINTIYRENLNSINPELKNKYEGYIYSPHTKMQIRDYSSTINPILDLQSVFNQYTITGTTQQQKIKDDYEVPNYALELSPNVYKWRRLLEIGEIDPLGSGVDYPFESGAHYIHLNNRFYLKRQDPPCEFYLTSQTVKLPTDEDLFKTLIKYPTFLDYGPRRVTDLNMIRKKPIEDILDYDGQVALWSQPQFLNQCSSGPISTPNCFYTKVDAINYFYPAWGGYIQDNFIGNAFVSNVSKFEELQIDMRFLYFYGDYNLGTRDTGGACVNYNILGRQDVTDDC